MIDRFSRPLLAALRVPPEPRLPAGEPGSARVFRAGANFWRLRLVGWSVQQAATLAGFASIMIFMRVVPEHVARNIPYLRSARVFEALAGALWVVQLPITLAILRLDYALRWYIVTDRAARLREGIVRLREMTFTLANVQDIRIQQGPLQRLLGLADVELRTAGGTEESPGRPGHGARAAENLHLARFRGVDNAEAIRDLVVDRMKKVRGAGLGDPEDAPPESDRPPPVGLEAAARELAEASAALRATVSRIAGTTPTS